MMSGSTAEPALRPMLFYKEIFFGAYKPTHAMSGSTAEPDLLLLLLRLRPMLFYKENKFRRV